MQFGVSYFGNRILKHVNTDLKTIRNTGFNYVLHTISEFDFAYHYDNIADIVKATQDLGLKAHVNPWGIGKVFGGEPFSGFVSQHYLDTCQVLDNGSRIPMACPNAPAFNDYMQKWIDFVIRIQPDAVFWDEPHFHQQGFLSSVPGRWGCRCDHCKSKFHKMFGYAMPEKETEDVHHFKQASLKEFLSKLMLPLTEHNIKNILYVTANLEPVNAKSEWEYFSDIKYLDSLSTGPYWIWHDKPLKSVSEYSEVISELCLKYNLESQIWMQCCKIPAGRENEISTAVELATAAGIKNIAFWGFEGCAHESWISCENPQKAWETATQTIQRYTGV